MKTSRWNFALPVALMALLSLSARHDSMAADFAQPELRGTIYATDSGTNQILYLFKRTATRSNGTVHVVRDFLYPSGSLAARESIIFTKGKLTAFELDEKQTGARGTAKLDSTERKLIFTWSEAGKNKSDSEALQRDTIVGDMLPYFIVEHWNELMRGQAASFRFIASSRLETVGFKLVKEADVSWRGTPAVRLRMEPSSVIIRQLVDPLFFIVEKEGPHRVLEYVGRTTPKRRDGTVWKDLDARTVYEW